MEVVKRQSFPSLFFSFDLCMCVYLCICNYLSNFSMKGKVGFYTYFMTWFAIDFFFESSAPSLILVISKIKDI